MTAHSRKELVVLIDGRRAGVVTEETGGQLRLTYEESWRNDPTATPLSLSMPAAQRSHADQTVRAFLWGLLPDSEAVLDRWAREHQVSARNPLALLRHVGEDCAGAAQFVRPDRVESLLAGAGGVEWTDETTIAARLRDLRRDPAAWHTSTSGQFSLAGAQAKTALYFDARSNRWGDPWGTVPTTHILKPAIASFDDHDLNEHLCLQTARLLSIPAAISTVTAFGDERAIVIERYDRTWTAEGDLRRVHQEDMCQAAGMPPTAKYQSDGGPGPEQIIDLLRRATPGAELAAEIVDRFVDALALNWVLGGTDAHAKNYSVLLAGDQVRLAPLYDVASALPYRDMYAPKLRMAMRIGGEYRLAAIKNRHWRRFAVANDLAPEAILDRIADLAARVPEALATTIGAAPVREFGSALPARLLDQVGARADQCRRTILDG